jgi:membrane-associated protease RseP (regulator of RpoE activity)
LTTDTKEEIIVRQDWTAFLRLAVGVILVTFIAWFFHGLDVLLIVAALVLMVMLHELGHFVAAKLSGMKVTEYFFGFGPRIWSVRHGETEYGIKAIPAGGYVKILGMTMLEEVVPEDEPRSYRQATFPRRIIVASAGSFMHFAMAFGLLWGILAFTGVPPANSQLEVTGFYKIAGHANPALSAGMRRNDFLYSIDGKRFKTITGFTTFIQGHARDKIALTVQRDGKLVTLNVVPVLKNVGGAGVIGIDLGGTGTFVTTNPLTAVPRAGVILGQVTRLSGLGFAQVFSLHGLSAFVHEVATAQHSAKSSANQSEILSLPGAVNVAAQGLHQNVSELLYILVAINIFVGMANMIPILPLDGGHVAIAVYERIRSRRERVYHANVQKLMPLVYAFVAFLLILSLSALYVNILQPPVLK